ncbi:MAG TPA: thermonuclease family protein [Nitriliruptorales bacterium]|nr:thermonuclease family protein [Nitriliruptorales bacterium]
MFAARGSRLGPPVVAAVAVVSLVVACGGRADDPAGVQRGDVAPGARDGIAADPARDGVAAGGALPEGRDTEVTRVVDGDTIVVDGGTRVRLIGIDAPETVHPSRPVECFGHQASGHLRGLLPEGTRVRLEPDVEATDRYRRELAYVWRSSDGLHVNLAMLVDGFAQVTTVPPNIRHVDAFVAAQRAAREGARGLWRTCPAATRSG